MPAELTKIHEIRHSSEKGLEAIQSIVRLYGIDKAAYLQKMRAKDPESIIKKLLLKRKNKHDYSLINLTDLIGLRFLSLFKEDLPDLVGNILSFIADNSRESRIDEKMRVFFSGKMLLDSIEEAIIYRPNREKDIAYSLVIDRFKHAGFRTIVVTDGSSPRPEKGLVIIQRKEIEYSSIHLITRISGRFAPIPPEFAAIGGIPIEFQIRTAFEDVWAEIDHETIYKTFDDQIDDAGRSNEQAAQAKKAFAPIARELSTILKRHIEACSDTADHIKSFVRKLGDDQSVHVKGHSESLYPQRIRVAAKRAVLEQQFNGFADLLKVIHDDKNDAINNLDSGIELGQTLCVQHELQLVNAISDPPRRELRHLLNMELALLYIIRGEARRRLNKEGSPQLSAESESDFHRAYFIYNSLSTDENDKSDPVIYYRLGVLQYYLLGERARGLSYFEEAQKRLHDPASGQWLGEDPIVRLDLMYRLAFEFYLVADEIRLKRSNVEPADDKLASVYLKAAQVSFEIEYLINGHLVSEKNKEYLNSYRIRAVNTGLDSFIQFLRSAGVTSIHDPKLKKILEGHGLSCERLAAAATTLEKNEQKSPAQLDTLRNFYLFSEDYVNLERLSEQVLKSITESEAYRKEPYKSLPGYVEEMQRDARTALTLCAARKKGVAKKPQSTTKRHAEKK